MQPSTILSILIVTAYLRLSWGQLPWSKKARNVGQPSKRAVAGALYF